MIIFADLFPIEFVNAYCVLGMVLTTKETLLALTLWVLKLSEEYIC